jgi:ABC-type bacteriocin/lantibiotic exporter with double-glycine peptidase domain
MAGFATIILMFIFWIAMFVFSGPLAIALLALVWMFIIKAWSVREETETTTGSETQYNEE